ncbi:MAG: hypothetical protein N4A45_12230 [Flavobacteriales bacterium]|jgi:isocitrate dehydrogenase|nr:hypothetical protein [Flavobacteriales bacterium]
MKKQETSNEPPQLKRGKEFQRIVQNDYSQNSTDEDVGIEEYVSFNNVPEIKQKSGRLDIVIHKAAGEDFVMIMEIKATDWDKIKLKNINRNLYRHSKQLYNYIDKFMLVDDKSVGLAMLYPESPKNDGLKEFIEKCAMDKYCFPVYWYNELTSK